MEPMKCVDSWLGILYYLHYHHHHQMAWILVIGVIVMMIADERMETRRQKHLWRETESKHHWIAVAMETRRYVGLQKLCSHYYSHHHYACTVGERD